MRNFDEFVSTHLSTYIIHGHSAIYGYKEDDIVMLTDDAKNPRQIPTARNMVCFF